MNWLTQLQRLRKPEMISLLQAGDPRKFPSEPKPKNQRWQSQVLRTEGADGWKFQSEGGRSVHISPVHRANSCLSLLSFVQTLDRLDGAHLNWTGQSALLNPPTQMLLSSETSSQTHPEVMFRQIPMHV